MKRGSISQSGASLPELMIATLLVATFFASIFEVNAFCLRLVNGSKENVAAIQGVQDRLETLRNLAYTDLTNPVYIRDTVMPAPSNVSEFSKRVVEEVSIYAYDTDSPVGATTGTGIRIRRPAGATSTPSYISTPDANISNAK